MSATKEYRVEGSANYSVVCHVEATSEEEAVFLAKENGSWEIDHAFNCREEPDVVSIEAHEEDREPFERLIDREEDLRRENERLQAWAKALEEDER